MIIYSVYAEIAVEQGARVPQFLSGGARNGVVGDYP
jgi:hypothetical protein